MCGICDGLGFNIHDDGGARNRIGSSDGPLKDSAGWQPSFDWQSTTGLGAQISDFYDTTERGKPVLEHGGNVPGTVSWQIDSGWALDVGTDGIITYGFYDGRHAVGLNNHPGFGEGPGYTPFTAAQKAAAKIAINNWDELIAPDFREVTGPGASEVSKTDILLANTTSGPAQAWAYYGGYDRQYKNVSGDVWIADPRINPSNNQFLPGQYGLQTLNHELGHSLGLSHPGTYNFSDDVDGIPGPDPITYVGDAQYFQDSHQFSIMSYFDSYETGAQNIDWNVMRFVYPSTPMVDDVFVVQQKYGVETATRSGNDTYGFNSTATVTNEAMKFKTGEMFTIFTIWDAAGEDTLDLSGYYTPSVIDLREGAYSSGGGWGAYDRALIGTAPTLAEINANNADAALGSRSSTLYDYYFTGVAGINEGLSWKAITGTGAEYLMEQNIGIAYGAIIENAIGGHGADRINGNQADNEFTGGAGADTFVFADYSGEVANPAAPGYSKTVIDTSIDRVLDFETGVDKIDLTEFGAQVEFADLHIVTAGTTNTISFDRDNDGTDDFTFIIHGSIAQTDFIFG